MRVTYGNELPESTRVIVFVELLPVQLVTVKGKAVHPEYDPVVIVVYLEDGKVIVIVAFDGIFVDGVNSILYSALADISVGLADIPRVSPHEKVAKFRIINSKITHL